MEAAAPLAMNREDAGESETMALPLNGKDEAQVNTAGRAASNHETGGHETRDRGEVLEPGRALAIADFAPPSISAGERLIRLAYRFGVPGSALSSPLGKTAKPRILSTVASPRPGRRQAGVALRAGHFLINGVKAPIAQMDFSPKARLTPPFEHTVHGFGWLRDLAASAPRDQVIPTAERVMAAWLEENAKPGKGPAWSVENTGNRLLAWLVHAPLILSSGEAQLRGQVLAQMESTARWLDRNIRSADDRLGEVAGWCAITAAGLLLPEGHPRRLFGEAGLVRALGELVADDGGVLSRSPLAQMEAIGLLVDLTACYAAMKLDPPQAIETMKSLLVPPLLALMHRDAGLGNWQGGGAVSADRVAALVEASGVRARPLKDVRQWGYQRVVADKSVLQFDAAPPPLSRHSRSGCASTLAFELSANGQRIVVNCGGAALAGGQVPVRIEQGLRATAAHSTLALDNANSTAVLLGGKLGSGVTEVEVDRRTLSSLGKAGDGAATRIEASHDGYGARYGLLHRRILIMRDDGSELRGEDLLVPAGKKGKRGKIAYAIRFHIGPGVEIGLAEDGRGAGLALPDGTYWQFRLAGEDIGSLSIEESMWVDGQGKAHPIEQLVIEGLTSRGGGNFSWLLKRMG
ncbi:MAG: heparinase II/III family protein [Alteripontixanthobacter sp.]